VGNQLLQPSFTGGELSPSLYARVDLARFNTSLRQAKNFIVRPWGGVSNRSGFQYCGTIANQAARGRLSPFIYSTEVAYLVELGDSMLRFWVGGALLTRTRTITGVTQANPAVVTIGAGHAFVPGQQVTISGVVGMTQLNGNTYTVGAVTATTLQLSGVDSTGFGAYVSGGSIVGPVTIVTPWADADLPLLRFTQSADVMFVAHGGVPPQQLTRTSADTFTLAEFVPREGPFLDLNADQAVFLWASAITGPVTVNANSAVFTSGMVGSLIYLEQKELARIPPWTQGERGMVVGTLRRSDGKTYKCVSVPTPPAGNDWQETGSWRPTHDYGRAWDGGGDARDNGTQQWTVGVEWEYQDSGYGIVKITGYTSPTQVSGEVVRQLPVAVVGGVGAPVVGSPWTFSGDGATTSFSIAGATSDVEADYNVRIGGVYVAPNPYFVSPPGAGPGGGGLETP
jgi:hypothetical protein